MDKLLNFVAALEEEFNDYRVAVSPISEEDFDFVVTCRQIYEIDSGVTHAYNLYKIDDFRNEFDRITTRTGVNEDVPEIGSGTNAKGFAGEGLAQHWVEFKVRV